MILLLKVIYYDKHLIKFILWIEVLKNIKYVHLFIVDTIGSQ